MNKITRMLLLATMLIAISLPSQAQETTDKRKSREELAETQARRIAHDMAFDDKTTSRFVEVYCQCQREVWTLGPRKGAKKRGRHAPSSGEGTTITMQERFDRSQKLLDIRKKYYTEYRKFLSEEQVERVYQLEQQMMKRIAKRHERGTKRR